MSCSGTGTRPDGSSAPLTIDLYIDHERTHLLWYTWDRLRPAVRPQARVRVSSVGREDSPSGLWRTLGKRVG